MEGTWTEFEDKGEEYADPNHMYSKDLDVFGHGSLFQWINTTKTFFGRERLRRLLEFLKRRPDKSEEAECGKGAFKEN